MTQQTPENDNMDAVTDENLTDAAPAASAAQDDTPEGRLAAAEAKITELQDAFLRAKADAENQRRRDSGSSIADLMSSDQRGKRQIEQSLMTLNDQTAGLFVGVEVASEDRQLCTDGTCARFDDRQDFVRLL